MIPLVTQLQIVMILPFVLGLFYIKQKGNLNLKRIDLLEKSALIVGGILVIWPFLLVLLIYPTTAPPIDIIADQAWNFFAQGLFGLFMGLVVWMGIIRDYLRTQ